MIGAYNITGFQGDNIQIGVTVKDSNGSVISLDGYSVRGEVRISYGSTGILLNLNPVITNHSAGTVLVSIPSQISKDIPVGEHVYDIERYPSGIPTGNSIKLLKGRFSILPEVTR